MYIRTVVLIMEYSAYGSDFSDDGDIQSNLSIMNPGYNELPDITSIDLKMYTYSTVNES